MNGQFVAPQRQGQPITFLKNGSGGMYGLSIRGKSAESFHALPALRLLNVAGRRTGSADAKKSLRLLAPHLAAHGRIRSKKAEKEAGV